MSDWTPSQQTQQEIQLFVQSLLERLPVLLGIDEAIAGCEVTNTDPYSTGTVPRYIKVRINDYLQDVYYRGVPQNLAVGDFVSVLHYRQGNIYEVFGSSGTTGATWQWKLLSPDGSIDPVIYTDNSGNTLTQTGAVLVGADASLIDFPEARLIVSQDDSGHSYAPNIAIVGESACDAATNAVGIGGVAKVVDNSQARGVVGRAVVDASADTGEAIGVQGLSNPTHAGGTNIGVLGTAANGANNFSFYGQSGILYNADNITLAAGKTVDGVEVGTHDHSGGANMGVQIDIEDTTTTEMDDTKVLTPDGAGGVEWTAGGGSGAPLIDSVNKTVKPGGGGDYTTIQAAVNYFKGKVITGACTITIDAGTYAENVVIEELLTSKDGALTLVGDTRALAGFCMIDGSTINPASKANGGSGTCSLTYGANEIQVFGSTTDPNFDAGGIVAGDTLLILGNDGNLYERTVQEIPATTNIFILTTNSPAIGDTGSAVIIIPNRRIEPASGIALRSNVAIGIHVDGIYAQSTDTYGVYVSYGGMLDLATSLAQGATGIYSADYISRIIMNDCASVSGTVISYPASSAGFIPDASTTVKGLVELATDAETQTGTATTVVITPANLRADVPATPTASRGVRLDASGHLKLPVGGDIYPDGDGRGYAARFVNGSTIYDTHFRGANTIPTGYAWQGAPFAAPTVVYNQLSDYMRALVVAASRGFMSRAVTNAAANWQNKYMYGRFTCALNGRVGMRVDNGTDNNYVQMFVDSTANDGTETLKFQYRDGGGAITTVTSNIVIPTFTPICISLLSLYSSPNYYVYGYLFQPEIQERAGITNFNHLVSWAPAAGRAGIFIENTSGASSMNYTYCDWFKNELV